MRARAAACAAPAQRLRINAQLVDTHTDFPLWSERYDREMADVFEVQDEIARKIAEALRVTLSPQEQEALAAKPTENLQAYDLYLRGKSFARRADAAGPRVRAADVRERRRPSTRASRWRTRRSRTSARSTTTAPSATPAWIDARQGREPARERARRATLPEIQVAEAWVLYADGRRRRRDPRVRQAIERKPDCEGAYYLLGRALFAPAAYQEVADMAEAAIAAAGEDYNVYVPIINALGALGKKEALRRASGSGEMQALESAPAEACRRTPAPACCWPATTRRSGARRTRCAR